MQIHSNHSVNFNWILFYSYSANSQQQSPQDDFGHYTYRTSQDIQKHLGVKFGIKEVWYLLQVHIGTNEGVVDEKDLPLLWLDNLTFIPKNYLSKKFTMNQLPLFWVQQLKTMQVTNYKIFLHDVWNYRNQETSSLKSSFRVVLSQVRFMSQAKSWQSTPSYLQTVWHGAD